MARTYGHTDTTPWRAYDILRVVDVEDEEVDYRAVQSEVCLSEKEKHAPARVTVVARYVCQSEQLAMKLFEMDGINKNLIGTGYQAIRDYHTDRICIFNDRGVFVFDLCPDFNPRTIVDAIRVYRLGIELGENDRALAV